MNRAWIPAGALAGVSVAGLVALGPLTDSLGNQVEFPTSVKTSPKSTPGANKAISNVPVSITVSGVVGKTETAALTRGGKAKVNAAATNSSDGAVALKRAPRKAATQAVTPTRSSTPTHKTVTPAKPKKPVKRQTSIGDIGESNPDHGLAGQSQQTSPGEQNSTPAS